MSQPLAHLVLVFAELVGHDALLSFTVPQVEPVAHVLCRRLKVADSLCVIAALGLCVGHEPREEHAVRVLALELANILLLDVLGVVGDL